MSFIDESDPNIEPDFAQFDDGNYQINGIHSFISVDGEGEDAVPVFVPDAFSDHLVARFRTRQTDGSEGPPASMNKGELACFLRALGADPLALTAKDDTQFLYAVQSLANAVGGGTTTARVKNGWVQQVKGATPPEGHYTLAFNNLRSPSGAEPVRFEEFDGGSYKQDVAYLTLEVVGDHQGNPTVYNGYRQFIFLANPFEGTRETEDGRVIVFRKAANGGSLKLVQRAQKLMAVFTPDIYEYQWKTESESEFGVDEAENPLPVIRKMGIQSGRRGLGYIGIDDKKRSRLDLLALSPVEGSGVPAVEDNSVPEFSALLRTIESLARRLGGVKGPVVDANDMGQTIIHTNALDWAREYLAPVWDTVEGLPSNRNIALLEYSADMSKRLNDALNAKYPTETGNSF